MPLGMIVDINPNHNASDVYALVSQNIVVNTILCSYNDILRISSNYDYCVDVTMNGDSQCGPGFTYNASDDTFIAPPSPPMDWVANAETDFDTIISSIQQVIVDSGPQGGALTTQQVNAAYNSALNDNPGLSQATLTMLQTVYNYVIASLQ
jgi:hypothetical protein